MRPLIGLAFCCTIVALLASAAPAAVEGTRAEQARRTLKVSLPHAGELTVTGFVLEAQSKKGKLMKPKLGIVSKGLPDGLAVVAGLRAHPTIKRAWIGSVVALLPKATRKTSAASRHKTFILTANGDVRAFSWCSDLRNPLGTARATRCRGYTKIYRKHCTDLRDKWSYNSGYLRASKGAGKRPSAKQVSTWANIAACVTSERDSKGRAASIERLEGFLGSAVVSSPPPIVGVVSCNAPLMPAGPNEIQGILTCDETIRGFHFRPNGNPDIVAWLPPSCTCDGKTIRYVGEIPGNTPFSFNVRTNPGLPPGAGGVMTVDLVGGGTFVFDTPGP